MASCSPEVLPFQLPFHGYVETTVQALRLIYAAHQSLIPRTTRRLNDLERRSLIKSGAVFIFGVEESGIKRWTDGLLWSPSRIAGNFLVYKEVNERACRHGDSRARNGDDSGSFPLVNSCALLSPGLSSYSDDQTTFKPNALIKKTITVTVNGSELHLVSYYGLEDIKSGKLKKLSSRPDIMSLYMPPDIFDLNNLRVVQQVEMGPDGRPRLV
ncbi:hypothetical protein K435DRAFT_906562 [Dendrothele bispora CBS 962.96]|uniref:Gti1/Pac2 family-domain-containing protein n=1 Tax=Dendrothele bispora (strain CBS 962.96) TaxID=1314807 RepID=A0A4S8MMP9_DENBC|nr:hypothetical protein K435DRAFT_906562 [Dendrothele bispora CBS 962.96]